MTKLESIDLLLGEVLHFTRLAKAGLYRVTEY